MGVFGIMSFIQQLFFKVFLGKEFDPAEIEFGYQCLPLAAQPQLNLSQERKKKYIMHTFILTVLHATLNKPATELSHSNIDINKNLTLKVLNVEVSFEINNLVTFPF